MKQSQFVWTLFMLVVFALAEIFSLHARDIHGDTVKFTVSQGDHVTIEGADFVSVSASDESYFRIYAGENHLWAEPVDDDKFFAEDSHFPTQKWDIKDASMVEVTLTSENGNLLFVHKEFAGSTVFMVTVLYLMLGFLFWIFGMSLS